MINYCAFLCVLRALGVKIIFGSQKKRKFHAENAENAEFFSTLD